MPTASFVCLWHGSQGLLNKKVPNKSHPIQPVKCSRCSNLVYCTLCTYAYTRRRWQWHRTTHERRSFSLFVSSRSLSIRSETGITIIHFSKCHLRRAAGPFFLVLMCFSSKLKTFSVHTIPHYLFSLVFFFVFSSFFLLFIYLFLARLWMLTDAEWLRNRYKPGFFNWRCTMLCYEWNKRCYVLDKNEIFVNVCVLYT